MTPPSRPSDADWWRQATVYQIYPRSFCDANGDGIGDLQGITLRVPYLHKLNVDAVWLSPFYPSPLKDGGYDCSDYRNVDPNIGTLEDFDEMMRAFKAVDIKVIVDIVPNHCSDEHPWFQEALKSERGSAARDRFHFLDGKGPDKSEPPNDWMSVWDESVWTPVGDGQWYLHLFDTSQPDFNWENEQVQEDFLETLKFWGDRGVAGFRVDVAQGLAKDLSEPFMSEKEIKERQTWLKKDGKEPDYHPFWDRDRTLEIFKEWRKVFNQYDPPLTAVGEVGVSNDRVPLYASPEGLGQAFAFDIQKEAFNAPAFRKTIDGLYNTAKGAGSTTTWVLSNHDVVRHATRYGVKECTQDAEHVDTYNDKWSNELLLNAGKEVDAALGLRRARAAILLLLALPGSTYMYQGEELGLPEVIDMPTEARQDPIYFITKGKRIGRDGCRVPIPWDQSSETLGFSPSDAKRKPWLPMPDWLKEYSAAKEDKDADSTLNLYREALRSRRPLQDKSENMEWIGEARDDALHLARPGGWEVIMNFSAQDGLTLPNGEVLLASAPLDDGKLPANACVWLRRT